MVLKVHYCPLPRNHITEYDSGRPAGAEKGGGGMEVGGRGRLYTYLCTVTTRMTSAFRWAAMRAILMFPGRK